MVVALGGKVPNVPVKLFFSRFLLKIHERMKFLHGWPVQNIKICQCTQ